ncbi:hypothetical protein M595_2527 [Lyngbya aestuarii BL J]|uniref:Uncharacterized protein n=1 Tax=Lyngbya aestuarii BL J TaxID=1348334 RepID=U7QJQ3_9CYAN|nr:hypothetical protein M595_2527 [Lyngbya aestuarii BL J]
MAVICPTLETDDKRQETGQKDDFICPYHPISRTLSANEPHWQYNL